MHDFNPFKFIDICFMAQNILAHVVRALKRNEDCPAAGGAFSEYHSGQVGWWHRSDLLFPHEFSNLPSEGIVEDSFVCVNIPGSSGAF